MTDIFLVELVFGEDFFTSILSPLVMEVRRGVANYGVVLLHPEATLVSILFFMPTSIFTLRIVSNWGSEDKEIVLRVFVMNGGA